MSDFNEYLAKNARLIILKELKNQPGHSANETILQTVLDVFGHRRSREWVRQQIRFLNDIGAIEIREAGSVLIAILKQSGGDHLEHRIILEGVQSPSEI